MQNAPLHEQAEYILHWSRAHLPDGERIAASLGIGAFLSLAIAFLVAGLWRHSRTVSSGSPVTSMDQKILAWVHAHVSPRFAGVARFLAALGSPPLMLALMVLASLAGFLIHTLRGAAWTLPVAIIGAGLLIQGLKWAFRRTRPRVFEPLLPESGYSFPSGHSFIAMVVYGLLGFFLLRFIGSEAARDTVAAATALLIVCIGISRVYVGVHFPTDVLAGWSAALPWLFACLWLHESLTRHWNQAGVPILHFPPPLGG